MAWLWFTRIHLCEVPSSPPSNIFARAQASWFLFWTRAQRGKLWSAFPLSRPFLGVGKWIALKNTLLQRLTRKSLGKSVSQHKLGSSTVFCECEENMNYGSRPCKVLTKKEKKKEERKCCICFHFTRSHVSIHGWDIGLNLPGPKRLTGFPGGASGEESTCQCRRHKRHGLDPWVGKIPWRRACQPTPVFLPWESYGQRSLVGIQPIGSQRVGHSWSNLACMYS